MLLNRVIKPFLTVRFFFLVSFYGLNVPIYIKMYIGTFQSSNETKNKNLSVNNGSWQENQFDLFFQVFQYSVFLSRRQMCIGCRSVQECVYTLLLIILADHFYCDGGFKGFNCFSRSFNTVCYSADGKCVLAAGRSKNVCIYTIADHFSRPLLLWLGL